MDHVDRIVAQWRLERPDLDSAPMAVIGRLSRASAAVDARLAATFANHGIDASTFDVLATLARQGAPYRITPAELAADSMITTSAVAQRLNRLDKLGLITREPHPDDGRGKFVRITNSGRELLDKVLPDHLATEETILAQLSTNERNMLAHLLTKLAAPAD
ncbi:MarR family transcriptional regulator [Cryobacterium sp. PH31-O1]|uniref:MarR family winged helix-turn-helix transcriptional regulator n=1 Tax=Cryobacterium sp. PH31-O1 TaxID=3046306 RepID=UPI0024BB8AEC|nr:MarR family transcriptional regulator [Cryobacterium sp. PH31-O1]MDJ0338622.1 MarR family transcriptional regulator [Cryobacterium sp. PH31-O1]